MLTGIHILMTYTCNLECDHCFLYSGPRAQGTMTLAQIRSVLDESKKIDGVEWIYFEGGEPFLFYPSLLEGIRLARSMGFKVGVVTNIYGAVSDEDADILLQPLADLGVADLRISNDSFHYGSQNNPAGRGLAAARRLGIPTASICIEKPFVESVPGQDQATGSPVIGGGAMFRGRAVDTLAEGLPRRPARHFTTCPHEKLETPSRVHVDCYGHVHLCQGISMGNMWQHPLSHLVRSYVATSHPICGPLANGGPAGLAEHYGVELEQEYVDECHCCTLIRRTLVDRFPQYLAPRQVYGPNK
ncbi:hypothetical protein SAMN05216233_107194 [Desulfoluna spongiiphila]|uniref:Radical SAM core domain-containing protein n=2 Tax=Desulfoluna spongiiphila TaxID=419481 RepID=A0A1G5F8B7_9BACT|nr:hypothetical protein SAMN05216233_107194 [Desulfoluna spongiiphila]